MEDRGREGLLGPGWERIQFQNIYRTQTCSRDN